MSRYHKIDGWRGYSMPDNAVAGASDTGGWEDSPCPTTEVKAELARFCKEVLKPAGIKWRMRFGTSSNVFCGKRWIVVSTSDFPRAAQLTVNWLSGHGRDTRYVHEADLDVLGYKPTEVAA